MAMRFHCHLAFHFPSNENTRFQSSFMLARVHLLAFAFPRRQRVGHWGLRQCGDGKKRRECRKSKHRAAAHLENIVTRCYHGLPMCFHVTTPSSPVSYDASKPDMAGRRVDRRGVPAGRTVTAAIM